MLVVYPALLLAAPYPAPDDFPTLASEFIRLLGYSSPASRNVSSKSFDGHNLWFAEFSVTGNEVLTVIYAEKTSVMGVSSKTTETMRHKRAREKRSPSAVLSAESARAILQQQSGRVWGQLDHVDRFEHGTFVGRTTPDLAGASKIESTLRHAGFACPSALFRMNIDLESGKLIECSMRRKMPKFPAQAPTRWITRTAAVAAGYPGPPQYIQGDTAELQWFEPSRGATCKLAWRLKRRSREVVVDAVTGAVLDVPLYGSSRPPRG